MITLTANEGKYLTNGEVYTDGTVYLPDGADTSVWYETDEVIVEELTEVSAEEATEMLIGTNTVFYKKDIEKKKEILDVVEALGGIKTETVQSDKIGYDFNNVYVGETLVRQEYVQQGNPTGTEDNPMVYTDGVPLINNAFYLKDGKKYVYMDGWVEW